MNINPEFVLYGTSACHLCDEAQKVFTSLREQMKLQFGEAQYPYFSIKEVDIAEFDELIEQFGTKVPVLLSADLSKTLEWPFDEPAVYQFMMSVLNPVQRSVPV